MSSVSRSNKSPALIKGPRIETGAPGVIFADVAVAPNPETAGARKLVVSKRMAFASNTHARSRTYLIYEKNSWVRFPELSETRPHAKYTEDL